MSSRRKFIKTAMLPVAGSAFLTTRASAAGCPCNIIEVGPGGDFTNVASAIASITDNSINNPYLVLVLPGVYSLNWSAKSWVTIQGSGPLATIFEGSNWGAIKVGESNVHLKDFGIRFTGSVEGHAAISRTGFASDVFLSGINIEHAGHGAAIKNRNGDIVDIHFNIRALRTERRTKSQM